MRLVVRCDASAAIGLGHVARAFALAEELGPRLSAVPLFLSHPDPLLERFLEHRPVELRSAEGGGYALDEVLAAVGPGDVVVTDSYALDAEALDAVAARGVRHVVVDDFARMSAWPCDVVVNPNLGASPEPYHGARRTLVGPAYALLRRDVRRAGAARHDRAGRADRVLVCLGGGDWGADGARLLAALGELTGGGLAVRAATDAAWLPGGVDRVPMDSLHLQLGWADVAVLGGGTLKYEAAAAGVPMLLVAAVGHQVGVAKAFAATGAAGYLGALAGLDAEAAAVEVVRLLDDRIRRMALAETARSLVDGFGAVRVADAVLSRESD